MIHRLLGLTCAALGTAWAAAEPLNDAATVARACSVFCSGPLMAAVQTCEPPLFNDSKTFVDCPLLVDPEDALDAFAALGPAPSREALAAFVGGYFGPPGSDLVSATPPDWTETPPLLQRISNATWREFAASLNGIWPELYREVSADVFVAPQRFSLLRRRHGLVLPGGRFRESYYWDSYWIVRGLVLSGMLDTAQGLVQNLLDDVLDFGFVPNGGRVRALGERGPRVTWPRPCAAFHSPCFCPFAA